MQIDFPFDLSQELEDIGEAMFGDFETSVKSLYEGAVTGAAGVLQIGAAMHDLVLNVGHSYVKQFLKRRGWITWAEAERYMHIHDALAEKALSGELPFAVLYLLGGISSRGEFAAALSMAKDGKSAEEIEQWLDERREKIDGGRRQVTEDDVKAALRRDLEAAGEVIISGERYLANGMKVDLLTKSTIWECKVSLTRTKVYEALGQTESAAWELPGHARGLAAAFIDDDAKILAHQCRTHGIEIRVVDLRVQAIS